MLTTSETTRPLGAVHVDLDGARHIYRAHGWSYRAADDRLFETGLHGALEVFARLRIRATLFVIAEDMRDARKRTLVRAAVDAGHEVASHSMTHRPLTTLGSAAKRDEITNSREQLASTLGTDVRGFRAPGFRMDVEGLNLVADAGYDYDSSAFSRTPLVPTLGRCASYRPVAGSGLIELPVPSLRLGALPFHPSYSLVVGDWYFKLGVREFTRTGAPFVLLYHLTDFSDRLPRGELRGWKQQLFTLSYMNAEHKCVRSAAMLDFVGRHFTITSTTALVAACADAPHSFCPAPAV